MSLALAAAALAGASAGAGVAEVLADRSARRGRRTGSPTPAVLARLGRRLGAPRGGADLDTRLDAAGRPLDLSRDDLAAIKVASGGLALVIGGPMAMALPGRLPWLGALLAPVAGWLVPDLLLARAATKRAETIAGELPELLDLLRVAVAAGLPPARALADVGSRHGGLLAAEWLATSRAIGLGVPATEALDVLRRRCPGGGVAALVAALERSARHGAPLAPTLAAQSTHARAARAHVLAERAARAGPKIQLTVALLLVPSAMLLVAAALAGALMR
jgi:tight adherence protein C